MRLNAAQYKASGQTVAVFTSKNIPSFARLTGLPVKRRIDTLPNK
jgi:hypothetical protein